MKKTKEKIQYRTYDEALVEHLQKDPELAQIFLKDAFEEYEKDSDLKVLMFAIWAYAKSQGISELARKSKLNRENLYKIFNGKTEPKWNTMESIIKGVGFKISFQPEELRRR